MLVLTRKMQEQIRIGENIVVTVLRVKGNAVRLGIEAPRQMKVVRGELAEFDLPLPSDEPAPPHQAAPTGCAGGRALAARVARKVEALAASTV